MSDLPSRMTRLAELLDRKATLFEALAADHEAQRETAEASRYKKRAAAGRSFATDCRHVAKIIATKAKRGAFVRPHWNDVSIYTKEKFPLWPVLDVHSWFDHFESVGWKVNTKPMVDWHAAAANGYRRWLEKNPQAAPTPTGNPRTPPDPEGWREFLVSLKRPYKAHRFEVEWVRTEFANLKKK